MDTPLREITDIKSICESFPADYLGYGFLLVAEQLGYTEEDLKYLFDYATGKSSLFKAVFIASVREFLKDSVNGKQDMTKRFIFEKTNISKRL